MEKNNLKTRKKNRLDAFHYNDGYFFITVNVQNHEKVFGEVVDDKMILNKYGEIVEKYRININKVHSNVSIGNFVIMPNHLHGILIMDNFDVDVREDNIFPKLKQMSVINSAIQAGRSNRSYNKLSNIIKGFKQTTNKEIKKLGLKSFKRQKSFYDHIIRNENDMNRIIEYIELNPYAWENDEYYR
ncbi:MAG TPA: hypothetical protein PK674_02565 [Candidatus Absconditabacterales bacterium]|nr:hypothetical protein [Candidatus Absconditabacterales bacterium]HPK27658.1 hypothetical protein [Candidatus Absconditabacterales bacterium]